MNLQAKFVSPVSHTGWGVGWFIIMKTSQRERDREREHECTRRISKDEEESLLDLTRETNNASKRLYRQTLDACCCCC
jgi:hypothetical protein